MKDFNFYPSIEPFKTHMLKVDEFHTIYVEECGNPKGEPIVFLHGGPGAGAGKKARRFFDPEYYHIILFDQRGCGRSLPFLELRNNNIFYLVEDMEKIREYLKIKKWSIFAGSFGTTLALVYAIKHSEKVKNMILQGIFLARQEDINWYFENGLSEIYPKEFEEFKNFIPENEQDNLLSAYFERLFSSDLDVRNRAVKIWNKLQLRIMESNNIMENEIDEVLPSELSLALIEAHYFKNKMFWDDDNYIINRIDKIKSIPMKIAHGRFDVNTRVGAAYKLYKLLENVELKIVEGVGHSPFTDEMSNELIKFLEDIKDKE